MAIKRTYHRPKQSVFEFHPELIVQLHLLGPFLLQDTKPIRLPRRKVEALLAYLALYPQAHTREQLAALLWGDVPNARARTSLRTALRVLRQHVSPDLLVSERDTLQLNPDYPLWVDARELENAHRAVSAGRNLAARELDAVCDLYRGDLLAEFYEDWIAPLREHYRRLYLELLLYRVQQLRAASEYERALQMAQRVLAADPANENAFQHMMFCHVALGQRQKALQVYAQCVNALRRELNVEPLAETVALYEWITQTAAPPTTRAARLTNLPLPLNSFVGRQREMAALKEYLARERCVTLTGAGGGGKTRLAIQTGIELLDAFPDGVWWVELASLSHETQVAWAVAKALGVREQPGEALAQTVVNWLGSAPRKLLLILDNCEHLLDACATLAETLLRACSGLKILATSREPLRISGEQVWNLPMLAAPDAQNMTLTDLLFEYAAVRLFVERARLVKPDFALDGSNARAVVKICERLDGIPLAIELAAARVNLLSPQEIAARLGDRFNLLADGPRAALPRQQTLRALMDWSFDLLTPPERVLFWRLGVFSGGRTLRAIEAVCVDGAVTRENVLELLARLVAKSLLTAQEKLGATRYSFLDTIKQYAREKLRASGEHDAVRDRHLAYYAQMATQAERELAGPQQALWMAKLELDHYNLRNALEWAFATAQREAAFSLAAALWRFWKVHGHYSEGRAWYARLLDAPEAANVSPRTRAAALYAAGMLAYYQSDAASAEQYHRAGLGLYRELRDELGIARALAGLGLALRVQGAYDAAQTCFQDALTLARQHRQQEIIASCLRYLGLVAVAQGEYARAVALYEQALPEHQALGDEEALANLFNNLAIALTYVGELERAQQLNEASLEIRRRLDDLHGMALSLHTLAYYARVRGDWANAHQLLREALTYYQRLGAKENTLEGLESIAFCALHLGNAKRAAMLYGAAQQLRTLYAIPRSAPSQQEFENEVARVRAACADFDAAWDAGQAMTLEQAMALGLTEK